MAIKYSQRTTIFTLIATLGIILSIGNALHLRSFGGAGLVSYPAITLDGQNYQRGATYTFAEAKTIEVQGLKLTGEARTQIVFTDTRPESLQVNFLTGRIRFVGPGVILVNKLTFANHDVSEAELVHYSWLNQVDVNILNPGHEIDGGLADGPPHTFNTSTRLSTETGIEINK